MPSPAAASSEPEGSGQRRFGASELQDIKHTYEQEGFVILDGLISLAELQKLRQAAEDVTTKTRAGQWPHRRTAKKQFPPWDDDDETDVWGCQHVWHPQLGHTRTFAGFYGSPGMLDVAQALMGCERQEMMISLFNMLVEPQRHDFGLSWHRDSIKSSVDDEEEARELRKPRYGVQWNAALYDDDCLLGVPRSHSRVRTAEERHATTSLDGSLPMPNGRIIHLDAGQIVYVQAYVDLAGGMPRSVLRDYSFYDSQILHRGTYDSKHKRATLHGSYQDFREDPSRGGGVLQHGTEWMVSDEFRELLDGGEEGNEGMLRRALDWSERARRIGFSYAQENI